MYELYPYFTNDGTVGLFSPSDDDIYHSTYGALTESWEKFIIPSNLAEYVAKNKEIKILDLCYGIGYNTKTALQTFINEALKNSQNNFLSKSQKKIGENFSSSINNIAPIDTDNISTQKSEENIQNNQNKIKINNASQIYNEAIDTDNLNQENINQIDKTKNVCNLNLLDFESSFGKSSYNKSLLIDAVDTDKILINLSPFITSGINDNKLYEKYLLQKYFDSSIENIKANKISQVKKIKKSCISPLKKQYKISEETPMLLFLSICKSNPDFCEEPILRMLMSQKKFSPFFCKNMLNFARFYINQRCKQSKKENYSAFLHNIYYRYVSQSYKNVLNLLFSNKIDVNFHQTDARQFIQSTENKYNFIFLDAFTPAKCPALWSLEFFRKMTKKLEDDGVILTYSNSAAVRNAMLLNGLCVGKIKDEKTGRFIGTIASKNPNLIEYALEERDIALINSKAGICYRDPSLESDNKSIIINRELDVERSTLSSSSSVLKGKNEVHAETL